MRIASAIDWAAVSAPATPVAGRSMLYFLSDGLLRSMDSGGTVRTFYSSGNLVPVTGISATGTPSGTTYLRGDGTWATPAGGGGTTSFATIEKFQAA
jgi:hypothetical protein